MIFINTKEIKTGYVMVLPDSGKTLPVMGKTGRQACIGG
jgi:hypothetical protein